MGLFFKQKKNSQNGCGLVQTAPSAINEHPFSQLNSYIPLAEAELSLYESLREAVPIIDAAIGKTVRLIGDFSIICNEKKAQIHMDEFVKSVNCGCGAVGINAFIYSYFDQLLTYGTAIGEMILSADNSTVDALYNGSLRDVELKYDKNPLNIVVCEKSASGSTALPYQQLLFATLLNPDRDKLKGNSLLKGLPFVSSVLLKIFNSIGTNWEHVGNVRFAVTYKPNQDSTISNTKQRATEIASAWSKAMRDQSQVCDFVSVGDVSIKVIGADNQILDCDIPVKHLLEQIVAKLSIPPFLLGLSWSSTERMSSQQADILTSELEYYRSLLSPVITKICAMWLRLNGYDDKLKIEWSNINLQDETELASARLMNAQAEQIEKQLMEVKS